jgi:hypothetical protein
MSTAGIGVERALPAGERRGVRWRWIVAALVVVFGAAIVAGGAAMWRMHGTTPSDLNLSTTRLSAQGHYRATIVPRVAPIPINSLHAWTLHVETPDGRPVTGATIAVDGGMPQHGHGLPTQPQVTRELGNGDYLVEGLKFQMEGWWTIAFAIEAAGQRDDAQFNLILK